MDGNGHFLPGELPGETEKRIDKVGQVLSLFFPNGISVGYDEKI